MAIGGMIGGGIFSVLGVTIELAGHLAFACFLLGGAVALVTAHSYAGLARRAGRSGRARTPTCARPGTRAGRDHELAADPRLRARAGRLRVHVRPLRRRGPRRRRGRRARSRRWPCSPCSGGQPRGVGASSLTEDAVVAAKLAVLAVVAGVGLAPSPHRLAPLANEGYLGVVVGAASIFVAYEGFELLSLRLRRHREPRPDPAPGAVPLGRRGRRGLRARDPRLADAGVGPADRRQREVAFADRGPGGARRSGAGWRPAPPCWPPPRRSTPRCSRPLVWSATSARPTSCPTGWDGPCAGCRRPRCGCWRSWGPRFAMLPGINELLAFGSATFLAVFGLVNHLYARTAATRRREDRRPSRVARLCGGDRGGVRRVRPPRRPHARARRRLPRRGRGPAHGLRPPATDRRSAVGGPGGAAAAAAATASWSPGSGGPQHSVRWSGVEELHRRHRPRRRSRTRPSPVDCRMAPSMSGGGNPRHLPPRQRATPAPIPRAGRRSRPSLPGVRPGRHHGRGVRGRARGPAG